MGCPSLQSRRQPVLERKNEQTIEKTDSGCRMEIFLYFCTILKKATKLNDQKKEIVGEHCVKIYIWPTIANKYLLDISFSH